MKKRIFMICAIAIITMLFCAGCGNGTSSSSKKDNEGKITLVITQSSSELGDRAIYQKYMDEHPNIIIEEVPMSNSDTKLLSMIASGNPPDLIRFMGYDEMPVFVQRGLLMPLDDYIKESGKINLDSMYDVANMCRYDGEARGTGSLYGLPKDWSPTGLWINKKAFKEAGIPLPSETEPMTWDEFATIAKKLVKMNGESVERHGCITALKLPTLLEMYLNSYGQSMWTSDFNSTTLESAATKNAMKYFQDLHESAAIANSLYPASDTIGYSALLEDKVGMVLGGYWFCGAYRSANLIEKAEDALMFVPAPVGTKQASYCLDLTCLGIFSGTEHPEEAYELWEYLMHEEYAVNARASIGYGMPASQKDFDMLPYETDFDKQALNVVTNYQIKTLDLSPQICPYISYTSLSTLFDKYYLPVLYDRSTLEDAMKTINKETEILIKEGKDLVGAK